MTIFLDEIFAQPDSLRRFGDYYRSNFETLFQRIPVPQEIILTGMGASFHAAWSMAFYFQRLGLTAMAVEAVDLYQYGSPWLSGDRCIVYVSQSGQSAEVAPLITRLSSPEKLIAVTNNPDSPLAKNAAFHFPLMVEKENSVATQTYLNTLTFLWLLGRHWVGELDPGDFGILDRLAGDVRAILDRSAEMIRAWLDHFSNVPYLVFTGSGPQAATARQAAQTVAEWAKIPTFGISTGALRHGFIEIMEPGSGVVVFASPGEFFSPSLKLAKELDQYGAKVLFIQSGRTIQVNETVQVLSPWDEFLSPVLDIVPVQLYAEALARQRGLEPGFRYISKVIKDL